MTAKKKAPPIPEHKKEDPKALRVERQPTEALADAMAHTSLRPTVQAALTLLDYNKAFGEMSINTLLSPTWASSASWRTRATCRAPKPC